MHDSFIVPFGEEDRLNQLMKEAFEQVTYKVGIKAKFNENLTKKQLYIHGAQDGNWFLSMIDTLRKGDPTHGYKRRLERLGNILVAMEPKPDAKDNPPISTGNWRHNAFYTQSAKTAFLCTAAIAKSQLLGQSCSEDCGD